MRTFFRPALAAIIIFSVLTGVIYPALVTVIAQVTFPGQANGSLIEQAGQQRGSSLIGQQFDQPEYFWGRLSATGPVPYNAAASSGSNYGPLNPALAEAVQARIDALKAADPSNQLPIPVDLVTASASGLDPEISPAAANYQVQRVAAARGLAVEQVQQLVEQHTSQRTLGVLGEPRVNVLQLNIALDQIKSLD
ncbi:MAG TPA: potassium-transporting ATPase subunit C [Herpetosiphon sp.]|uniref:Potassium-transporting ATPase KdpC subunit n=1 Tax=Herpetosiphon aurantiacus (strain ATCC 23779 / DSM 785 / 114-95) TaxID=316274 RepID=KDPC_HERA2|nr:potassium-transporting ATPase subunit KdpC [Herpetosiphon sp.]A9AXV2.1 RecName: Full=Potassium-transporting ATPase KdpC subunit; AltName: Full=ATP phosphohydrolase [potassium-transporting] C chain; AltName: Full=Potassium-binding and translocating subunit C; AltName: Full=Potassium-translocating ATPase C chain [Herpetosiphon aurantiacus DSM 785]ABX04918.1 potassium-transporting ATPase, C subunit [Herpetosiphon aurantiacus DSM 785]HBW50439.1 potassium-transporting ATPase subunit C [Herpetosiph